MKSSEPKNPLPHDKPPAGSPQDIPKPSDSSQNKTPQKDLSPKAKVSKADILKFVGLLVFIVLLVVVGIQLIPYFDQLGSSEGRLGLIADIKEAGIGGIGICFLLQFIQIVVAFIPGEVTQLAIGAIYGPFWGTLIVAGSALISSIFVFTIVRKLGAPFVQSMIGSKDSKILNFLDKDSRLNVIVFILFLIPGLPKDVFTYLVPLTKMRPINFFVLSTLGRIPGIAASAYIGNAAIQGDYTEAIIVAIIAGGLGLLGIIFNKQILSVVDKVENALKQRRDARKAELKVKVGTTKEKAKEKIAEKTGQFKKVDSADLEEERQ